MLQRTSISNSKCIIRLFIQIIVYNALYTYTYVYVLIRINWSFLPFATAPTAPTAPTARAYTLVFLIYGKRVTSELSLVYFSHLSHLSRHLLSAL